MVARAVTPCRHVGCGQLVRDGSGYCASHARLVSRETDQHRGSAHARGYTSAWSRARTAFLRAHPLCAAHEKRGMVAAADVVDHVKPHRGDMDLFWDRDNWQALCKRCHDVKTATEDRMARQPASSTIE